MTKATVYYNGRIIWEPPVIYKSACIINVEFFPFDIQSCKMKFGTWTYDGSEIDLIHHCSDKNNTSGVIKNGINFVDFYPNVEWDVLKGTAVKNSKSYPCCPEPYIDVTFEITMKRKTLFHTVNLIMPCVAISFLTVIVFYLPVESGEKITLSISILLSLTVFFLLLAEIIPPTSLVIPLIGKYLLFTMSVVTLSIVATIVTIRIHFLSPSTVKMSRWVSLLFLEILPVLLLMKRPKKDNFAGNNSTMTSKANYENHVNNVKQNDINSQHLLSNDDVCDNVTNHRRIKIHPPKDEDDEFSTYTNCVENLNSIVNHLKKQDLYLSVS